MAWVDHYVTATGTDTYANSTNSATPCSLQTAVAGCAAGDRINIKAGNYVLSASLTFSTAGTQTAPIWWRGYKTTIGDKDGPGGARVLGTDIPEITNTNATDQIVVSAAHNIFSNLGIVSSCTSANGIINLSGTNARWIRCDIQATASNTNARAITASGGNALFMGCRFKATTTATYAIAGTGNGISFLGCVAVGGVSTVQRGGAWTYGIIYGAGISGVIFDAATALGFFNNCTIYGGTNCVNATVAPTTGHLGLYNCILAGATNGLNNTSGANTNGINLVACQFYSCTNNLVNITEQATVTDALTASMFSSAIVNDPFMNKGSNDFTLIAGAAPRQAGYPGVFDTTVMTGYPDLGAVQAQAIAAGGSSYAYIS